MPMAPKGSILTLENGHVDSPSGALSRTTYRGFAVVGFW